MSVERQIQTDRQSMLSADGRIAQFWSQRVDELGDRMAVRDLGAGREWSFKELDELSQSLDGCANILGDSQWVVPSGSAVDFIVAFLSALKLGRPLALTDHPERDCSDAVFSEMDEGLPDSTFLLKRSSGTSGEPRWIAFTESQLIADVVQIKTAMGLCPEWPNYAILSLSHSYGFSNLILPLVVFGIPLIIGGSPFPENVVRDLQDLPEFVIPAAPAIWKTWLDSGILNSLSARLKVAISAGAPLDLQLEQAVWDRTGIKIHNFYGSSECGGIAYDSSEIPRTDPQFAGFRMPNVELRKLTESGGRLEVRGPTVGLAYWPAPDASLHAGIFQTGDIGEIRNQEVYLTGRATDRINVAGRKVAPETVESALLSLPDVERCLAFGIDSENRQRGEEVAAVLALKSDLPDSKWNWEEMRSLLSNKLRPWEMPRKIWITSELKPNERGKLSRVEWRKRFLSRK